MMYITNHFKSTLLGVLALFICSCQGTLKISIYNNTNCNITVTNCNKKTIIPPNTQKIIGVVPEGRDLVIEFQNVYWRYRWPLTHRPVTLDKYFDGKMVVHCRYDDDQVLHIIPLNKGVLNKELTDSPDVIHIPGERVPGKGDKKGKKVSVY